MLLTGLVFAVAALAGSQPADLLPGCRPAPDLAARVAELRQADWSTWTRKTLAEKWPEGLEFTGRDYDTNEVVGFRRSGRVIEGRLECGERYLFAAPVAGKGDWLREFTLNHAEVDRSQALAVASLLAEAVGAPDDAEPAVTVCIHCADPGEEILSRQWEDNGETSRLQVYLRQGVRSFVVTVVWSRSRR
jgi:hypothetical protein